jgi:hypothetical protein
MNRWQTSKFVGVALLAVVLGGLGVGVASAEPQRRMEAALRHLREAREELREASADKGGHREQALDFVTRAIRQVEEGIEFADRRERHEERRERH